MLAGKTKTKRKTSPIPAYFLVFLNSSINPKMISNKPETYTIDK